MSNVSEVPPETAAREAAMVAARSALTMCEAFQAIAQAQPHEALALRTLDGSTSLTWADLQQRARAIVGGLHARGIRRGDTLAMMLVNRPEFNLVDVATMHLGVASLSLYNTLPPEQIRYQLEHSGTTVVVTERQFLDRILAARPASVRTIVSVDEAHADAITLAELEDASAPGFDFEAAWRAVDASDVLALLYTSGTTGNPKGVELPHSSIRAAVDGIASVVAPAPGGRALSFLPAAHMAERLAAHYYPLTGVGASVTSVANLAELPIALRETRPTMFTPVPRLLEKLKAGLEAAGITDPTALDDGARVEALTMIGLDQAEFAIVGGAPTNPEVMRFFIGLGLRALEAYGMTETGAIVTMNTLDDIRIGTCGKVMPGMELRLLEDGELCVRGPAVMKGYRNDPARTAETVDADGWLHTGDIATIDDDGHVRIVDRKKEMIINSAGKNMSPVNIEFHLKASSPLIGQAICVGDARPFNVALLVLDPENAARWAAEHGVDPSFTTLAANEELDALIASAVAEANTHLNRAEQIKKYAVLPTDWLPAGDELTPTSKLKRRAIHEKYAPIIEQMYSE